MKKFIFLILLSFNLVVFSQEKDDFNFDAEISSAQVDSTDWSIYEAVELEEMKFYAINLKSPLEKKYYLWLEKRVNDVYPFVEKAVTEYYVAKDSANKIERKRDRKKFIKKRYKELADQYESKLKKLTTSRGQILCKLIERETDKTAFDIIKELRGGFNAFVWNTASGAFNIDLKQNYNPDKTREDLMIEVILQRGFISGKYNEIQKPEGD